MKNVNRWNLAKDPLHAAYTEASIAQRPTIKSKFKGQQKNRE